MNAKTISANQDERHFIGNSKNGKLLEKYLYRHLGFTMPQWNNQNIKVEDATQEISIKPRPFPRNLFKAYPYFVGNTVQFYIKITGENKIPKIISAYYVHEYFCNKQKSVSPIKESMLFSGNVIDGEGDIKYTLSAYPDQEGITFLTARVINTDRWFPAFTGLISGVIVTLIGVVVAWILGYIKIIW